ncbi:MAG: hypothetical protein WDZ48_10155, partial [Pirellulales bacterium]
LVRRGERYAYATSGVWQIGPEHRDITGDGLSGGAGRLEGVIFRDYTLGEPFALSAGGTLTAPADGKLFLRCREAWNELADNAGFMAVKFASTSQRDSDAGTDGTANIEPPGPADVE